MSILQDIGVGAASGVVSNVMDLAFGRMKQKQQLKGQKEALAQQNAAQLEMWNATNYGAQMKHLKEAGLNPGLLYGMGGAGGATTGNASAMPTSQGGHGMDIAGAAQLALLKAQRENIEADTVKKKVEAEKTAGVDTELGKGQVANLAQQTKNAELQNEIMGIDKRIKALQEDILDATQYYEMGKVLEEWRKLSGEARTAAARGDIDTATTEEVIKQESIRTAGMLIENRLREKNIELTDAQINKISADIEVAFKEAETGRWNAESNAKNANTNANRALQAIASETGLGLDDVQSILSAIAIGAQFGKGGVGKPKANPAPNRRARYDKWGTKTSRNGYDLK